MYWNKSSAPTYGCIKFTGYEKKEKRKGTGFHHQERREMGNSEDTGL